MGGHGLRGTLEILYDRGVPHHGHLTSMSGFFAEEAVRAQVRRSSGPWISCGPAPSRAGRAEPLAWRQLPLPQVDAEAAASKAGEFGSQLARVSKVLEKKGESRENAARCCKFLLQETKSFEDDEAPLMLLVCERA